jgi:succinate dehydrogenase / fumarate reductase cytochrome b subunit
MTGIALAAGALLFAYWLTAAAYGPGAFANAQAIMGSIFGRLVLFGFTLSLFFHLCNGIRHLVWDAGRGFELPMLRATGWLVLVMSVVLSIATFWAGYAMRGGM